MHCNICQRPQTTALPLNCAACARNVLYQSRVSLAHTLLEQEAAVGQSEQYLKDSQIQSTKLPISHAAKSQLLPTFLNLQSVNIQQEAIRHQTQLILSRAKQLRLEVEDLGHEINRKRAGNLERRNEIHAARKELARRRTVEVGRFEKSIAGVQGRWDAIHARIAESRLLLCREAASLYGLKIHSHRGAASASYTCQIGGLPIYNLKDLNNVNLAIAASVITSLAHLVHLVSHYLALRLPAEVVLPHHDCPFPIILTPETSYLMNMTPNSRARLHTNSPRPPPPNKDIVHANQRLVLKSVHTRKKLSTTAKEDPQTYAAIADAMTLLAWNVAWLCKIQGFDVGANSWEEVCDVGKNLWQFFAAQSTVSHTETDTDERGIRQDEKLNTAHQSSQQGDNPKSSALFGHYSHGTIHSNLVTASGSEILRGWRLQDPIKITTRVKQMLLSDRTGAGWELLEGKEWESQLIRSQKPEPDIVVDASAIVIADRSGAQQMSQNASDPRSSAIDDAQERAKGTSGWMKLRDR
ncbi:MAG: hypothetical protein Q9176_004668 [Flavoplaca citrina]